MPRSSSNMPGRLFIAILVVGFCALPSCGSDPAAPAGGGSNTPKQWSWVAVDSFVEGGQIRAVFGTGPGNIFGAYRRIQRKSDGWQMFPEGGVVRFNGTSWSQSLYDIHATGWDVDLWASSPNDVYLADGHLWHFDGTAWVDAGIDADVAFGLSETDVYAATRQHDGAVYHFDGAQWSELATLGAAEDPSEDQFRGIHVLPGPFLVLARNHSIAMWDGTAWTKKTFTGFEYIEGVWAAATNDVYAAGDGYPEPRVWHFDGAVWSDMQVPDGGSLTCIWGLSADDIYAGGREGTVFHYDGVAWSDVAVNTYKGLCDIWGSGSDDVYAVGDNEKVLHFDGARWRSVRKDSPDRVGSVWAESPDRYVATSAIDAGTIYFNDNGVWTEHYITGDRYTGIRSIAGTSLEDLYVLIDRTTYHFDGNTWSPSGRLDAYYPGTMWFPSPGVGFAIGGGSIYQFRLDRWYEVVSGLPGFMSGLWGASADAVYAINSERLVYFFDGDRWQTIPSPVDEGSLGDIAGVSANEVYVLAGSGIFRWNGTSWRELTKPDNAFGNNLVLNEGDNIFLHGGCWLSHFDGVQWQTDCSPYDPPYQIIRALDGSILQQKKDRILLQRFE